MKKSLLPILFVLSATIASAADERWVERTLRSMSVDEKIGQMLMAQGGIGQFRAIDSEAIEKFRRAITEFHVGAVHAEVGDSAALAVTLNELQGMAKIPLLVSANLEGGAGYALYGATRMPLAMAIGATGDEALAYEAASVAAREGRAVGVNVNFYPVADVNNNPENPIINIRSFGEDPSTVARYIVAYVKGTQDHGQIATVKHFPGHGDVAVDSHLAMPTLDVARERLDAIELPPFRAAIDAGVGAFMTAHIALPQLEPEKDLPATLSKTIMTGLLRDDLGFKGILFTDSMGMRGVSAAFEVEDATIRAVEAGADIVIGSRDLERSYRALQGAVRSGRIPESRLDQSVRRILRGKAALKLQEGRNRYTDVSRLMETVGTAANRAVAQKIADHAITLVKDDAKALPLRPSPDLRVVQINLLDNRTGWREGPVGRILEAELPKRFPRGVTVQVDDETTASEYALVRKLAGMADAILVNGFVRVASYKGSIDLDQQQMGLLRELIALKKPLVYTSFGSPFVLTHLEELPAYAVTYDISSTAEMAAIRAIAGEIPYSGRLPINLAGYKIGHGLTR